MVSNGKGLIMVTWTIKKRLEGNLKGIYVTDTLTQDATLPAPFHGGQYVKSCGGCDYTVISVSR
jgi:hypothetical protein